MAFYPPCEDGGRPALMTFCLAAETERSALMICLFFSLKLTHFIFVLTEFMTPDQIEV